MSRAHKIRDVLTVFASVSVCPSVSEGGRRCFNDVCVCVCGCHCVVSCSALPAVIFLIKRYMS